jgi:hypothetical protein
MNQFKSKLAMAAAASAVALGSAVVLSSAAALAAEQAVSYGRAGGGVGAERIQQLAAVTGSRSTQTVDLSNWYGRGGGTVGSERVEQLAAIKTAPVKAYAADATKPPVVTKPRVVYGRAGVPLPFGD